MAVKKVDYSKYSAVISLHYIDLVLPR